MAAAPTAGAHGVDLDAATTKLVARAQHILDETAQDVPVSPDAIAKEARRRLAVAADDDADELIALALDAAELSNRCHRAGLQRRERLMERVAESIANLRRLSGSADLIDAVCREVITSCGFQRVMISRVDAGTWYPWEVAFADGTDAETAFVDWTRSAKIPLDDMTLETDVLTSGRAAAVYDTRADPRTQHPVLGEQTRSTSYVVAPIIPAGRVVGFLHADYHPTRRRVDDVDRDAVWAFAEGFGRVYERVVIVERLRTQRVRAHETFQAAEDLMSSLANAEIELVPEEELDESDALHATSPAGVQEIDELLTDREREVLLMMVRGLSNNGIAEQLVIQKGTVKSHVKHILRKTGAVNRTDAISRYLRGGLE
jgi:LuxR family transcriptional regulator, regulator of acetate metabolism